MKPQESLDAQKFLEDIQAQPLVPQLIKFQLAAWLSVTTNPTQIGNSGTFTYRISSNHPTYPLKGHTEGHTNESDSNLQLSGKIYFNELVFDVSFSITTHLDKQQSTAVVKVTFPNGNYSQYSGAIACW